MQLTTALLSLVAAAATTNAAPTDGAACVAPPRRFGIMALRSASPIHFASVSGFQNNLALKLPENELEAQCTDGVTRREATFFIKDGELFLYTPKETIQKLWTDRSGMGTGVLQYATYPKDGSWTPGRNFETKGWEIDENDNLLFKGSSFIACPWDPKAPETTKWTLYVNAGVSNPAWNEGCLGVTARTVTASEPVRCTYPPRQ
ncbi:hypothetical protein QBC38DRAFT_374189 [Podospora fimiseda]|uniref:Cell wall protein PhiA n=1 Tax=Podospora fimiseda TaxID=252190 RepID=A0AAN6YPH9_9PEZI|nr:hypothetical protein QBC38DRAFT_374189 [Podospora fimiseda]